MPYIDSWKNIIMTDDLRNLRKNKIFGDLNFYKLCVSIAVPVMAQQLIMGMVSLIDNFMVAELGDIKMAAVNVANQLNFIYIWLY